MRFSISFNVMYIGKKKNVKLGNPFLSISHLYIAIMITAINMNLT